MWIKNFKSKFHFIFYAFITYKKSKNANIRYPLADISTERKLSILSFKCFLLFKCFTNQKKGEFDYYKPSGHFMQKALKHNHWKSLKIHFHLQPFKNSYLQVFTELAYLKADIQNYHNERRMFECSRFSSYHHW